MCGVYFIAETAETLISQKAVLIPDANAACSLADWITAEQLRAWKAEHPGAVIVSYVNTTAAAKGREKRLLIHPECGCTTQVLWTRSAGTISASRSCVFSTEKMLQDAERSPRHEFLVATETGILHRLPKELPQKRFEAADPGAVCR